MRHDAQPWYLRLLVWTLVCGASAAPSFVFGAMAFEKPSTITAMLLGVATFIAGYTWMTGTAWAVRLRRRPFVKRTLRFGYATRIALSAASLVPPIAVVDIWCGLLSIHIVTGGTGANREATALDVYAITMVQGVLLNIALILFMALIWSVQRLMLPLPPKYREGACETCGYDLRASRDVCPECGAPIPGGGERGGEGVTG